MASSSLQQGARLIASSSSTPISSLSQASLAATALSSPSNATTTTVANYVSSSSSLHVLLHRLLDRIALFSPRTWYGILQTQTQSAFTDFDGILLAKSILAAILPLCLLVYALAQFGSIRQRQSVGFTFRHVAPVVLASPWTLGAGLQEFLKQCRHLATPLSFYWTGRMQALPSATETLEQLVLEGRVTRHRRYDIYWPPPSAPSDESSAAESTSSSTERIEGDPLWSYSSSSSSSSSSPHQHPPHQKAVLLLPGFGIDHAAYAEVARRLTENQHGNRHGLVVVVASMEPLRLAHKHLGADVRSMTRLCQRVEREWTIRQQKCSGKNMNDPTTTTTTTTTTTNRSQSFQWNLMGHSAGAFGAMHLFQQFQMQQQQQQQRQSDSMSAKNPQDDQEKGTTSVPTILHVDKLILWGCAAMLEMSTDLSSHYSDTTMNDDKDDSNSKEPHILRIQATQDSLVHMMKPFQEEFDRRFPGGGKTVTYWIPGGTHQGFASYESTWVGSPDLGDAALSYADQQDQACDLTIRFLTGLAAGNSSTSSTTISDDNR